MDMQKTLTSILVDLNEVQMDLALSGQSEASEKIRGVKQMVVGIPIEPADVEAVVAGYRYDAIEQCERTRTILEKISRGDEPSDNELMFVRLAAEQLMRSVGVYMQRKMLVECPGMAEVING